MATKRAISISLPIIDSHKLGGFHQEICEAALSGNRRAVVYGGFGLGYSEVYVSINGKRVLSVDCLPLIEALVEAADAE